MCLSVCPTYVCPFIHISYTGVNLSKHQWILTKLGMIRCIDIVEFWFGIANGQILSIFDSYLPATCQYFLLPDDTLSECKWIVTKLYMCIDIAEIWFIAKGKIWSIFDRVICPPHVHIFISASQK